MRRQITALAIVALVATACASDPVQPAGVGAMNMGDPSATPANVVPNAELAVGAFEILETAPAGYGRLSGTAALARHSNGTTVTVELAGLLPATEFIAHVHGGDCGEAGGDHFKFDASGGDMPPNEIHLRFTSDSAGAAVMTVENSATAGTGARSLVIHPVALMDAKVACAEF
ncbi:MAG: superoxide dismutase family protein [Acidimicrobiia bacterium]|nr:superoxide dismutase family protein [Acidimicrobiia bacterium]